MMQPSQPEWITLTQASREFGRTRQAIEKLVKEGKIECRPMGQKQTRHIHRPTLLMRYAGQAVQPERRAPAEPDTNLRNQPSLVLETITLKAECNRLAELLRRVEEQLMETKKERDELRLHLRELERERTQHLAEMRTLLSGKSEGLLSVKRWLGK